MTKEQIELLDGLSDAQIEDIIAERERRRLERPSPTPWNPRTLMVVDANGIRVAHCGAYGTAEQGVSNCRILACGPDGVELAAWCLDEESFLHWLPDATKESTRKMCETLLVKAGLRR